MFVHYNRVLREALVHEVMLGAQILVRRWQHSIERSDARGRKGSASYIKKWRSWESWREGRLLTEADFEDNDVSLEQLVQCATHLGLNRGGSAEELAARLSQAVDEHRQMSKTKPQFVTTIHMITSGIIKLSNLMRLPQSRKVYRGLGGMALPGCFFWPDEFGCRGGTEAAFMSTTLDVSVAIRYLSKLARPLVFEFVVGQVNRGAEVGWCSQYPLENEVLFPPLCNLEVIGEPTIQRLGPDEQEVLVFNCNISVNLKSLSREELEARRHTLLLSSMAHQLQEIERDLHAHLESIRADPSTSHCAEEGEIIVQMLLVECKTMVENHRANASDMYNIDERFHQFSLQEAAMMSSHVMNKFRAWKDRGMCRPSNFSALSMQEWSAFFEGKLADTNHCCYSLYFRA